jgi:methanogenic corrinoid protein MtbC1
MIYEHYLEALCRGDRRAAMTTAQTALNNDVDIRDLYIDVFQRAMHEVGRLWETNQLTVAQEHLATAITQSVMAHLYNYVFARPPIGHTMVATCIGGELHELGIRMVSDFFELEGWDVYYLGANMPADDVVDMVRQQNADLLAISVTLNGHVMKARDLIQAVRAAPGTEQVRVMVGGHPFNRAPHLYETIGADFTAANAREAVQRAMEVVAC